MKKALLIVDVQNDFLPGGALAVPEGDKIIPLINQLSKQFDCVVATKDWHPIGHVSFATTHHKLPGEVILHRGTRQELWPDHCIQGTKGADFSPLLETARIKKVFFKGSSLQIDSYSAFYDNAHLRSTGLGEYLQALGIEELFIAGLTTEYCVKYSVLDAAQLGFKTYVLLDACRGIELAPGNVARALEEMKKAGATLISKTTQKSGF